MEIIQTMVHKRRTQAEMQALRDALLEEAGSGAHAHTVRHLFYRLTSRKIVQKNEAEYKRTVMRLCGEMREKGRLPWDWICDETRWMRRTTCYTSMEAAVEACRLQYRRDALAECADYLEIWCEKNTLTGVLSDLTDKYDVPLMISVGFSSKGFLHQTAETIYKRFAAGKRTFIYQVGDHDPSGIKAWEAIQNSIKRYLTGIVADKRLPDVVGSLVAGTVTFERLALTPEQIAAYDLPSRPTKGGRTKNTHAKGFVGESTEVDAMDTDVLLGIVEAAIQRHIPAQTLDALRVIEESEREALKMFRPSTRKDTHERHRGV